MNKFQLLDDGLIINKISNESRVRLGIVQSFQKNSLFPEMTVLESIMISISHRLKDSFNLMYDS